MTVFRRVLVAGGLVAGLAGAYFAGAAMTRPPQPDPGRPATARSQAPEPVAGVNGLKVPDALRAATAAAVAVEKPTDVLTGAVPVPADALRASPPAKPPEFVIPDLSK